MAGKGCGIFCKTYTPWISIPYLATLAKEKTFFKVHLCRACLQLQLYNASVRFVSINTHQGMYSYYGLYFGVASEPATFLK